MVFYGRDHLVSRAFVHVLGRFLLRVWYANYPFVPKQEYSSGCWLARSFNSNLSCPIQDEILAREREGFNDGTLSGIGLRVNSRPSFQDESCSVFCHSRVSARCHVRNCARNYIGSLICDVETLLEAEPTRPGPSREMCGQLRSFFPWSMLHCTALVAKLGLASSNCRKVIGNKGGGGEILCVKSQSCS